MSEEKTSAQIGYEAYADHQHWVNYQGTALPPWAQVRPDIKDAWAIAADAIIEWWEDLHDE